MIFIYHPNLKRKCISLGFKHCNRYKQNKNLLQSSELSSLVWNDPGLRSKHETWVIDGRELGSMPEALDLGIT